MIGIGKSRRPHCCTGPEFGFRHAQKLRKVGKVSVQGRDGMNFFRRPKERALDRSSVRHGASRAGGLELTEQRLRWRTDALPPGTRAPRRGIFPADDGRGGSSGNLAGQVCLGILLSVCRSVRERVDPLSFLNDLSRPSNASNPRSYGPSRRFAAARTWSAAASTTPAGPTRRTSSATASRSSPTRSPSLAAAARTRAARRTTAVWMTTTSLLIKNERPGALSSGPPSCAYHSSRRPRFANKYCVSRAMQIAQRPEADFDKAKNV